MEGIETLTLSELKADLEATRAEQNKVKDALQAEFMAGRDAPSLVLALRALIQREVLIEAAIKAKDKDGQR